MFRDKTVLITGGSGSFGTAFCKSVMDFAPKKLIIFSRDWLKQKDLREKLGSPFFMRWFIGDIRDKERLVRAMTGVDILIHAAAIKDLESCEYNPSECMLTNITGTQNVIDACIQNKVNKSILISTDKSVNPINTYGVSKAMAEKLWTNANKYAADDDIKFSVVRYGNVVGSSGSVVPKFQKMVDEGCETLPLTHKDTTRFWFEMRDAVSFVKECIESMKGGEIFIPYLSSIRITDLITAFGKTPVEIGLRLNEKIHEELEPGYDSGSNKNFLSIDEIKESLKNANSD